MVDYGVGIPRPDFLAEGSVYLGTEVTDGFLCHVWEKADFIWYYENVVTSRPVRFDFFDGMTSVFGLIMIYNKPSFLYVYYLHYF